MESQRSDKFSKAQSGFTLVELVVIIIVLGIVSVVAVPRLVDNSGFSEFALQQQLQSALRAIQSKSMYDSSGLYCYRMVFDDSNQSIGPSAPNYTPATTASSCGTSIASDARNSLVFDQSDLARLNVSFSTSDNGNPFNYLQFDSLGRPSTDVGSCAAGCQIDLTGEQTIQLCIGAQGYVRDC